MGSPVGQKEQRQPTMSLLPSMSDEWFCYLWFCHSMDFHYEGWKEKVGRGFAEKTDLVLGLRDSLISFFPFHSILPSISICHHSGGFP